MKRLSKVLILWLFISIYISGCVSQQAMDEPIIIAEKEKTEIEYTLGTVSIEDVIKTQKISCVYQQVEDQELAFSVSGKIISNVYAKEGDRVQKGQLLAELRNEDIDFQIQQLLYQIERNQLLIEFIDINMDYDISTKWLEHMDAEFPSEEIEKEIKKEVENIQRNYRYQLEDYEDAIWVSQRKVEDLQREKNYSFLKAGMSGTVSYVKSDIEGSTSKEGETLITIIDNSECIFISEELEWAEYLVEGVEVDMEIHVGTGAGKYKLYPTGKDKWKEVLTFALIEERENAVIEVGTKGTISLVLEEAKQVLSVPVSAVYSAEDEYYVYVVGENGMKEVKWITIGVIGDQNVEVVKGLVEGEKVILK